MGVSVYMCIYMYIYVPVHLGQFEILCHVYTQVVAFNSEPTPDCKIMIKLLISTMFIIRILLYILYIIHIIIYNVRMKINCMKNKNCMINILKKFT